MLPLSFTSRVSSIESTMRIAGATLCADSALVVAAGAGGDVLAELGPTQP
jgi:hypothetical protein